MKKRIILEVVIYLLISSICYADQSWPQVTPMKKSIIIDAKNEAAKFNIEDKNGKPLYLVECHSAGYEGDRDFDYSGDFECRLKSLYSKEAYSTLFTDNPKQSRDWQSRARVFAEELVGQCGDYPEYGRIRHFRLRGMLITLTFSEVHFKNSRDGNLKSGSHPEFESFQFDLTVEPDSAASSAITERVPFVEPPRAHPSDPNDFTRKCDQVIKKGK